MLRIVFCGTAPFAVPALQACATHAEVLAVVTQPDRPGDRGRPAPRPVADLARRLGIPVLQPERIRDPDVVEEILALGADALVVAAYGQIIPVALLEGHRLGGINVHGSLLPRWRGAAPVHHAILHGDAQTGVCIMRMERGLDTGPVYARRTVPLRDTDVTPLITDRLAREGADLLVEVLGALERGEAVATAQDDSLATLAPRLTRELGHVEWGVLDAVAVDRRVRALQPWPGVTASLGGESVRILAGGPVGDAGGPLARTSRGDRDAVSGMAGTGAVAGQGDAVAGTANTGAVAGTSRGAWDAVAIAGTVRADADGVAVATVRGWYRIDTVQPAGGRPMDAAAYLRGRRGAKP